MPNLTSLATNSAREYVAQRFTPFGIASRVRGMSTSRTTATRPRVSRSSDEISERLLDRIDPASQLDKLARFFWHRERLAALRGRWMYFYTDLKNVSGNGLVGVNIHTGRSDVRVRLDDPDDRFITDETLGLIYSAKGDRLHAYSILGNRDGSP